MLPLPHQPLLKCLEESVVPKEMRYADIINHNYRGISLLVIVANVFARVVLNRLHPIADLTYCEEQCGLRLIDNLVTSSFH